MSRKRKTEVKKLATGCNVFPAKANLLAPTIIFKQRILISGWFFDSTVNCFSGKRMK